MNTPILPAINKYRLSFAANSLRSPAALAMALLTSSIVAASADPISWDATKTGSVSWDTGSNWIGGAVPTPTDDVKIANILVSSTISDVKSFANLDLQSGGALIVVASAPNSNFSANSISIRGVSGVANFSAGDRSTTSFTVSGAILVEGDDSNTGRFSAAQRTTVTANSLVLGGNGEGARAANLNVVGPNTGRTLKFDIPTVTFNAGSNFSDSAAWTGGTIQFTGDVLLQEGGYTGRSTLFQLGRAGSSGTVKIDKNLTVDAGEVYLRAAIDLEVGENVSIGSDASILFGTETLSVLNKFTVGGSLTLEGGSTLDLSGDLGGMKLGIGKGLVIESDSKFVLKTGSDGTLVELGGNLDIKAQSLKAGSNFNTMRLTLTGDDVQSLEAAVSQTDGTFAVSRLELKGSTIRLENATDNVAGEEYFRTDELVNVDSSTLDLNGVQFLVGASPETGVFLTPGVYTEFGGTLTVIPESSTVILFTLAAAGLGFGRRFTRRKS